MVTFYLLSKAWRENAGAHSLASVLVHSSVPQLLVQVRTSYLANGAPYNGLSLPLSVKLN